MLNFVKRKIKKNKSYRSEIINKGEMQQPEQLESRRRRFSVPFKLRAIHQHGLDESYCLTARRYKISRRTLLYLIS